ncbi:MAG: hypothetical protein IH851_02855 [Armatimonadetes bacterium]|nr:hypothetical protein [Armatimonadota bacterium]
MTSRIMALAALLAVTVAAVAFQAVRIEWKPKAGNEINYNLVMTATGDIGMGPMDVEAHIAIARKVLRVNGDGTVVVEESETMTGLFLDGDDMTEMASGQGSTVTTTTHKPNGEVTDRKIDSPTGEDNPRMAESQVFIFPDKSVSPGDTWKRTVAGDYPAQTVFKYIGTEKVGKWACYKVEVDFRETRGQQPYTSKGFVWLSTEDGELVKGVFDLKNFEPQPGIVLDGVIQIERAG